MPDFSRLGTSSSRRHCRAVAYNSRARVRMAVNSLDRLCEEPFLPLDAIRQCKLETRNMKNSSMLELKIAKNLIRSKSGAFSFCACSSTRRWNSNKLRSRYIYNEGSDSKGYLTSVIDIR